ncbi:MAG: rod shape-determining protein MreD [Flavobacterium sp.]
MNSTILLNIVRFVLLLSAQILIFNNINFLGYLNPFPYILFIILYPVNGSRTNLLLASFFLGLTMDMFCNSGGVHAAASLILAQLRPSFFKFSFGVSYEYQTIKINGRLTTQRFSFILISVITHHLVLFILEIFKLQLALELLTRTLLTTVFTLIISIIIIYLFKSGKK